MSTPSIAERVAAGVQWLDENAYDWVHRIDLEQLDLGDCAACMLGQLYGHYIEGPIDFGECELLGFVASEANDGKAEEAEYAALTAEWVRVIQERRQSAGVTS